MSYGKICVKKSLTDYTFLTINMNRYGKSFSFIGTYFGVQISKIEEHRGSKAGYEMEVVNLDNEEF